MAYKKEYSKAGKSNYGSGFKVNNWFMINV